MLTYRNGAEVRADYGDVSADLGDLDLFALRTRMVPEMLAMEPGAERRAAMDALNATAAACRQGASLADIPAETRALFPHAFASLPAPPKDTLTTTDTATPPAPAEPAPAFDARQAPSPTVEVRHGRPLNGARFADRDEARNDGDAAEDLGEYVRGTLTGNYSERAAQFASEARAQSSAVAAQGGHLIPAPLAAGTLDAAVNASRLREAGAQVLPMDSLTLKQATVETIPTPAWRNESAPMADGAMTLGARTFTARFLAVLVKAPWELMDDAQGFGTVLQKALGDAFALELDRVGLYGSGVAPQPGGLVIHPEVVKTSLGANGAQVTWEAVATAVAAIQTANFDPTAIVHAPRTEQSLAMTKGSDGQYVVPPSYVGSIPRKITNQVPVNLTQGTATNASDVFVGDWSKLAFGIRSSFSILPLRERFADTGEVGFIGYLRADAQVLRPGAFQVIRGVKP
jgi:HK97 family phage major capsid protein